MVGSAHSPAAGSGERTSEEPADPGRIEFRNMALTRD